MRRGREDAQAERGMGLARAMCGVLVLCSVMMPALAEPLANGSGALVGPPAARVAATEVTKEESKKIPTAPPTVDEEGGGEAMPIRREGGAANEAKMPLGVPRDQALRLGGSNPGTDAVTREGAGGARVVNVRGGWLMGTFVPLLVVVALIAACAWGFRQIAKRGGGLAGAMGAGGRAPAGILFVLGRYPISRGMTLVLLQIDRRVLLVTQTARPAAMTMLCEITEPSEVASILSKARDGQGESIAAKFQGLVRAAEKQLEDEPYEGASLPVRGAAPVRAGPRKAVQVDAAEHDGDLSAADARREAMTGAVPAGRAGAMRDLLAAMRADGARSGGGQ